MICVACRIKDDGKSDFTMGLNGGPLHVVCLLIITCYICKLGIFSHQKFHFVDNKGRNAHDDCLLGTKR